MNKRRIHTILSALFTLLLILAFSSCGSGGGGGDNDDTSPSTGPSTTESTVTAAMTTIDDIETVNRVSSLSGDPNAQFSLIETAVPEAIDLINQGSAALPYILPKFSGTPPFTDDPQLVIYAKVLAIINDPAAVETLTDFLEQNLTGYLLWSIDSATYALKVLTDQTDLHEDYPFYSSDEVMDTIDRARTWLLARQSVSEKGTALSARDTSIFRESGHIYIVLTNEEGEPYYTPDITNPAGPYQPLRFYMKVYRDPSLAYHGPGAYQEVTSDLWVTKYGGTLVSGPEGDRVKTAKFAICGGYTLRETLKLNKKNVHLPWNGWSIHPDNMFKKLAGADLLEGPIDRSEAQEGDLVFWTRGTVPGNDDIYAWRNKSMNHTAIIEKVEGSDITVRSKNQLSSAFRADIDATYHNVMVGKTGNNFGKPYIFRFVNGIIPRMLLDSSVSGTYNDKDTQPNLQNLYVTVSGTYPVGTRSIIVNATGDGIFPDKPFRKAFHPFCGTKQFVLPLGEKRIEVVFSKDSFDYASQYGANPANVIYTHLDYPTLVDKHFFAPFEVATPLKICPLEKQAAYRNSDHTAASKEDEEGPVCCEEEFPKIYRGTGTYIYTWGRYYNTVINHECNNGETEFYVTLDANGIFDVDFVDNVDASIDHFGTQYTDSIGLSFGVNCDMKDEDPYDKWSDALWGTYANGTLELNEYASGQFSGSYDEDTLSGEGYTLYPATDKAPDKYYYKFEGLERVQ